MRGKAGGLTSAVFVCWVDPKYIALESKGARARAEALLGEFHVLARRHPDRLRFAGNGPMLEAAHAAGAIAGVPGIEGGVMARFCPSERQAFSQHRDVF